MKEFQIKKMSEKRNALKKSGRNLLETDVWIRQAYYVWKATQIIHS